MQIRIFFNVVVPDSIRLLNLLKAEARGDISINLFCKNISVEIANPPSDLASVYQYHSYKAKVQL